MAAGEASLLKFYTRPGLEQLQIKIQIQPLAVAGAASPCGVINTWIQIQMLIQIQIQIQMPTQIQALEAEDLVTKPWKFDNIKNSFELDGE